MSPRIAVDYDLCESNAICAGIAPDVFDLGDDETLRIDNEAAARADLEELNEAVLRCPKQALRLQS